MATDLSLISLRIFRAGLKHSLVDAKWPAFEEVFFGFDPQKVVLMSAEHLERLMQDARLIRHLGKLRACRAMRRWCSTWPARHGSFGNFLADWPETDIVGLWKLLSKRGNQLGGLSAPRFPADGRQGHLHSQRRHGRRAEGPGNHRQAAHQPRRTWRPSKESLQPVA
ncbi:DNA-3-methyladenine glycosylase I [Pseudomonas aeruginosa]